MTRNKGGWFGVQRGTHGLGFFLHIFVSMFAISASASALADKPRRPVGQTAPGQYLVELVAAKEAEFKIADKEAQRCRAELISRPASASGSTRRA